MNDIHAEYSYEAKSSDTVVIFTHGIQGSPLQFDYLIEKLDGLYSIENLLLPGHGKTTKEFVHSNMAQWQNYVDARVKQLENKYKNIILVGHSMGCLLSVQSAISFPQRIRGLFLVAMPLIIRMRFSYFKNSILVGFTKNKSNEVVAAARKGNSVSASNPFAYLAGVPRYIELLTKGKSTRELLREIKLPVTVVHSVDDEIVSKESLRYVDQQQNVSVLLVEGAGHYYYSESALARISDTLIEFIKQVVAIE